MQAGIFCDDGSVEMAVSAGRWTRVDYADALMLSEYQLFCRHHSVNSARWDATLNIPVSYAKMRSTSLSRFLLQPTAGQEVDHINGDALDNRRANMRLCSRKENCRNRPKRIDNTTGYIGIQQFPNGRWRASCKIGDRNKHLGMFATAEEAAHARDAAARAEYGEFAKLNFPD